ncbi:MAG: glycosyl hydrolase family 28-related protein, partial [Planctomycetota bacterium]
TSASIGSTPFVYNALAYGATADGVTDDAPALQTAINAATSAGGGVVFCPEGTYIIGSTLSLGRAVKLQGVGRGSTTAEGTRIKADSASVTPMFTFGGASAAARKAHSDLQELTIVGSSDDSQVGIKYKHVTNASLRYVQFTDLGQAEDIDDAARVIHNVVNYFKCGSGDGLSDISRAVVRVDNRNGTSNSEQIFFHQCLWEGNAARQGTAISSRSAVAQIMIDFCKFDYDQTSPTFPLIVFSQTQSSHIMNSQIAGSTNSLAEGIIVLTGPDASNRARAVSIIGNQISFPEITGYGLYADQALNNLSMGNLYRGSGSAGTAIRLTGNAAGNNVGPDELFTAAHSYLSNSGSDTFSSYMRAGQMILTGDVTPASPALAFEDGDTGIYEKATDVLVFATAGTGRMEVGSSGLRGVANNGPLIQNVAPTATTPSLVPDKVDTNTGVGQAAADQLSLIAGGAEAVRCSGDSLRFLNTSKPGSTSNGTAGDFSWTTQHFYLCISADSWKRAALSGY